MLAVDDAFELRDDERYELLERAPAAAERRLDVERHVRLADERRAPVRVRVSRQTQAHGPAQGR